MISVSACINLLWVFSSCECECPASKFRPWFAQCKTWYSVHVAPTSGLSGSNMANILSMARSLASPTNVDVFVAFAAPSEVLEATFERSWSLSMPNASSNSGMSDCRDSTTACASVAAGPSRVTYHTATISTLHLLHIINIHARALALALEDAP